MNTRSVVDALDLALSLMNLASQSMARAVFVGKFVAQAQAEGRDKLTPDEWAAIDAEDDAERQRLVDEIAKAKEGK